MRQIKSAQILVITPFVLFAILTFLLDFSDGIMSYITPIIIENHMNSAFLMGIILSISSFFGMFLDFYISKNLSGKGFKFYLYWAIIFTFLFAFALAFLPKAIFIFALAMVFWSIYYEMIGFSQYGFIHKLVNTHEHTKAWSILSIISTIAYTIGPLAAIYLMDKYANLPLYVSMTLMVIGFLVFKFFLLPFTARDSKKIVEETHRRSFYEEFKILKTLSKRVWVLLIFDFFIILVDVSFWSIGILFSESLRQKFGAGEWFMVIYGLPSIFLGYTANFIHSKYGKKQTSLTLGILTGFAMFLLGTSRDIFWILFSVLLVSVFSGLANILLSSVFEDYVARLDSHGNDIISLKFFMSNMAYAIGPIVLGFLSDKMGNEKTFLLIGIAVFIMSLLSALIVPRKIKMPQKELVCDCN